MKSSLARQPVTHIHTRLEPTEGSLEVNMFWSGRLVELPLEKKVVLVILGQKLAIRPVSHVSVELVPVI